MRTKTVFTDLSTIAHLWANQSQDNARTSSNNYYFDRDTIYSYGRHFPIARIVNNDSADTAIKAEGDKIVFFTTRGYSNTTAKHINYTRQACNNTPKLYMYNVIEYTANTSQHEINVKHWTNDINNALKLYSKARKKEKYISIVNSAVGELERYIAYFAYTPSAEVTELLTACKDSSMFTTYLAEQSERIIAHTRAKLAKQAEAFKEQLMKFRTFELLRIDTNPSGYDYLRYNKETNEVETSQAVKIGVNVSMRFYAHIQCILNGGTNCGSGTEIIQYDVKDVNKAFIVVGCHKITIDEINAVYAAIPKIAGK